MKNANQDSTVLIVRDSVAFQEQCEKEFLDECELANQVADALAARVAKSLREKRAKSKSISDYHFDDYEYDDENEVAQYLYENSHELIFSEKF
jgi:hypothetical protein